MVMAPEALKSVKLPVLELLAPILVPLMEPPVIDTALEFCVDIVPRPVMSVFGIVATVVKGLVPSAFR